MRMRLTSNLSFPALFLRPYFTIKYDINQFRYIGKDEVYIDNIISSYIPWQVNQIKICKLGNVRNHPLSFIFWVFAWIRNFFFRNATLYKVMLYS